MHKLRLQLSLPLAAGARALPPLAATRAVSSRLAREAYWAAELELPYYPCRPNYDAAALIVLGRPHAALAASRLELPVPRPHRDAAVWGAGLGGACRDLRHSTLPYLATQGVLFFGVERRFARLRGGNCECRWQLDAVEVLGSHRRTGHAPCQRATRAGFDCRRYLGAI